MAESPKPHVIARKPAGEPSKKPVVEARPTSKLDKNELLGLVGTMRTPRAPTAPPSFEDEVEIEKLESEAGPIVPSRPVAGLEKRVVRTVARRTPIAGMAPISREPVAAPAPAKPAPTASSDEYIDLFAEGSDHAIAPVAVATPDIEVAVRPEAAVAVRPEVEAAVAAPPEAPPAVVPPTDVATPSAIEPAVETAAPSVLSSTPSAPTSSTPVSARAMRMWIAIGVASLVVLVVLVALLR